MKLSLIPKALGHGLLGSLSLGFVLAGLPPSAKAVVYPGTDYLVTPAGGATYYYKLPGGATLPLSFSGLPIGLPTPNGALFTPTAPPTGGPASSPTPPNPNGSYSGLADTVVNRLTEVDPTAPNTLNPIKSTDPDCPINGGLDPLQCVYETGGVTPIEIVGLSLQGGSLAIPSGLGVTPGTYNLFAGLQKYYGNTTGTGPLSMGKMFIGDDPGFSCLLGFNPVPKCWDSEFTLNAMAFGVPVGSALDTSVADFVRSTLQGMTTPLSNAGPYDCNSLVSGVSYDLVCLSILNKRFVALDEPWQELPGPGFLIGENLVPLPIAGTNPTEYYPSEFYLSGPVIHDAGCDPVGSTQNCVKHIVHPSVPGPLPILGVSTAFAFARRLRKRCREAVKFP
jgi:hypothetical protein